MDHSTELSLICRVRARLCALPLRHVLEILRPLPVEPLAGAPRFVRGLAMLRGAPVPVVDAARLLGDDDAPTQRYVALAIGERRIALAVGEVLGVRAVPAQSVHALPPLLQEAAADIVTAIGRLDADLLLVLNGAHLLPEERETPGVHA
ncbi:MAG TPA: chemotaxis protein CheW [Burkholderiaceae bacterium]|nr:chemotaxis protein CheW [Burkholderiaceae bacterium]